MQDVNLTRFIDRMAQLITKYADAVDWDKLEDPDYDKLNIDDYRAETSVSASFFGVGGDLVGRWILILKITKFLGIF